MVKFLCVKCEELYFPNKIVLVKNGIYGIMCAYCEECFSKLKDYEKRQ